LTGSGLGLSMVQAAIRAHGGQVRAGRAPEGGAQFTVTLPLLATESPVAVAR
jgi:two-component system sensor histidine kinase MprB